MPYDWSSLFSQNSLLWPALGAGAGAYFNNQGLNNASSALQSGANQAAKVQQNMFNTTTQMQTPFINHGTQNLGALNTLANSPNLGVQTPTLQGFNAPQMYNVQTAPDFNFQFNPNDPAYQWRQQQASRAINEAAASRGEWNSRAAINALGDANMNLSAQEVDRQFGQAKDAYGLNLAGMGQNNAALSNQYNQLYQGALAQNQIGNQNLKDMYSMKYGAATDQYNRLMDSAKLGQSAASNLGNAALSTGNALSTIYGNLGTGLAGVNQAQGSNWSDLLSGLGSLPMQNQTYQSLFDYLGGGSTAGNAASSGGSSIGSTATTAAGAVPAAQALYGGSAVSTPAIAGATAGADYVPGIYYGSQAGSGAGTGTAAAGGEAAGGAMAGASLAGAAALLVAVEKGKPLDWFGGKHNRRYSDAFLDKFINPYAKETMIEAGEDGYRPMTEYYDAKGNKLTAGGLAEQVRKNPERWGMTQQDLINWISANKGNSPSAFYTYK